MTPTMTPPKQLSSAIEMLSRVLKDGGEPMSIAAARYFSKIGFSDEDKTRMTDLAVRNQCGTISPAELAELEDFANAGVLLGILQSKARQRLKRAASKIAGSSR